MKTVRNIAYILILLSLAVAPHVLALEDSASVPQSSGITENLGAQVDLTLALTDQDGTTKPLGKYLENGRPTIIVPVYFRCPRLCNFTLNGLTDLINQLQALELGRDYNILAVSINPEETADLATAKAENYYKTLKHPENGPRGWRFLTASQDVIKKLTGTLGFGFTPDGTEFAHAAGFMILSPFGKIMRYFYGVLYEPEQVRIALIDASEGRIGTTIDKIFLFCFRYDHTQGKYTFAAWTLMRVVSIAVVLLLFSFLIYLRRKEKSREICNG
ncbi:SCO family protein [bacterium]|nr:SCO family protein [bacterium]